MLLDLAEAIRIFRIKDNDSIMCGSYCIAFIECLFAVKKNLDYTNLLFPSYYKKNDKIIYKYFKDKYVKSKIIHETRNYLLEEIKYNE